MVDHTKISDGLLEKSATVIDSLASSLNKKGSIKAFRNRLYTLIVENTIASVDTCCLKLFTIDCL